MAAHDQGGDVLVGHVEGLGHQGGEAGRIQYAGHARDAMGRESGHLLHGVDHGVQGIGDHDDEGVGRVLLDGFAHGLDDAEIDVEEIVAAHARLARQARGHDDHVGAREGVVGI